MVRRSRDASKSTCPQELLVVVVPVHDGQEIVEVEHPGQDPEICSLGQGSTSEGVVGGQNDGKRTPGAEALESPSPIFRTTTSHQRI